MSRVFRDFDPEIHVIAEHYPMNDDVQDIRTATDDILNVVTDLPNQHVEIVNKLDEVIELLTRIATALEAAK